MKFLSPFRLASYLLVLFFAGHTAGGMLAQKSVGPDADAVFASMKAVHFTFNGSTTSWYGIWFAFGLLASVFHFFAGPGIFATMVTILLAAGALQKHRAG